MSAAIQLTDQLPGVDPAESSVRYDRPQLVGFIADARTEEALRDGLPTDLEMDLRRGGVRAAITSMQKQMTPRVLIIDLSGEEQPLSALGELANVVEPDVCVLLIGENASLDFYREVTRGLGAAEYLTKPLTRDVVSRHFLKFMEGSRRDKRGDTRPAGDFDLRHARRVGGDDDRGQPGLASGRRDAPSHRTARSGYPAWHRRAAVERPAGDWPAHGFGNARTHRRLAGGACGAARGRPAACAGERRKVGCSRSVPPRVLHRRC